MASTNARRNRSWRSRRASQTIERLARGLEQRRPPVTAVRRTACARAGGQPQRHLAAAPAHEAAGRAVGCDVVDTIAVDASDEEAGVASGAKGVEVLDSGGGPLSQAIEVRGGVDRPATTRGATERGVAAQGDWPPVLQQYDATPTWRCRPTTSAPSNSPASCASCRPACCATAPPRRGARRPRRERARRLLAHRHHLVDELHRLTLEMSAGLAEVAEEGSWVRARPRARN